MKNILLLLLASGVLISGFGAPGTTLQAADSSQVVFYVA